MTEADRDENVEGGGRGGSGNRASGGGVFFHASEEPGKLGETMRSWCQFPVGSRIRRSRDQGCGGRPFDIIRAPDALNGKAHPVSDEDIQAELQRLRTENELLKKSGRSKLAMKVSEKGALSVYGMGRFPVTLYKEQWLKLLDMGDEIRAFIEANNESLKAKE
jgi:hypothetical protein